MSIFYFITLYSPINLITTSYSESILPYKMLRFHLIYRKNARRHKVYDVFIINYKIKYIYQIVLHANSNQRVILMFICQPSSLPQNTIQLVNCAEASILQPEQIISIRVRQSLPSPMLGRFPSPTRKYPHPEKRAPDTGVHRVDP